ncbi:MAG: hypothetical protein GY782_10185 [Gammaproteobacteria bacterium]|nr:hypothetical protein [Gammaproteobacteria bacterium]
MMSTGLNRLAAKARNEKKLCFTSLAHHITEALLEKSVKQIKNSSSPGVDGQTVQAAKETAASWMPPMIDEIHRKGYRPPPTKRVYIPKPGKANKRRPIAMMPTIKDKALQRATAEVLNAVYEEDFLEVSYEGRPKRSAHQAIAQVRQ